MQAKVYSGLFWALVFFIVGYFFIKVHPLYIFDTDDWAFVQDTRNGRAWPVWGIWNPTRVFPEIFMPAISWLSVIFIYPFNADYIESLSIGFGITLSFFIIFLGIMLSKFFENSFKLVRFESLLFSLFFTLFLFYPLYRHSNLYLLRAINVTSVFYYTISALLCSAVVLWLLGKNEKFGEMGHFSQSLLIVAIYLSLNSNLFESIVLFSFSVSVILISLYGEIKHDNCLSFSCLLSSIKKCIHNNLLHIFIIIAYLIVLIYEANGGRASDYSSGVFELDIKSSFNAFIHSLVKTQQGFHILLIANLTGVLIYLYRRRKNKLQALDRLFADVIVKLFVSFVITAVFLILLCSKTGAGYLGRTEVVLSYFFYILALSFCSLVYTYKCVKSHFHPVICLLPLLIILFSSNVVFGGNRYAENSMAQFPVLIGKKISDDLISQIISADNSGKTDIEILVPEFLGPTNDNWPLALYGAQRLSNALYIHRIISRKIIVRFIPEKKMNYKYKID